MQGLALEVQLSIVGYLEPVDVACLQQVSCSLQPSQGAAVLTSISDIQAFSSTDRNFR
jgi:hypothetical protein